MKSINLPKVLLLDHEEKIQESLRVILEEDGHLFVAPNGDEAIKLLNEVNPDLIFLSEIEILKKVKLLKPKATIIMVAGEKVKETESGAIELGAFDLIRNPFNLEDLRILIKRALEQQGLHSEVDQFRGPVIQKEDLSHWIPVRQFERPFFDEGDQKKRSLKDQVSTFEKQLIEEALEKSKGILTHAAKLLGTTRRILKYHIDRLKIQIRKQDYK